MSNNPEIKVIYGEHIKACIPALAALRTTVFREFPYLYEGSDAYERSYLRTYTRSDQSVVVLALDNQKVIGAATGMPLSEETPEVKAPFIQKGLPLDEVFYFGESVLLKSYRGLGIGKTFMREREQHALQKGYSITAFCGVVRPANHPRAPKNYRPLNSFWEKIGYHKQPDMITTFEWKDLDENSPSSKEMVFWIKRHPLPAP